jgi:small-conductance mechanosensitive channel
MSGISILLEGAMAVGDQVVLNSNPFLSGRVVEMGARVVKLEGPRARSIRWPKAGAVRDGPGG